MQTGNGRIDLIIPCYNGRELLPRALASVAMQTVAERVDVTLVDDCSPDGGCADIAERFRPLLSVRQIRTPRNGGQGMARQFGIDCTRNEFLAFMDQDDSLLGPFALEALLWPLNCCDGVIGRVVFAKEDAQGPCALSEPRDMPAWVHGRVYRRALLDRYGVRFAEGFACRQNEDAGFNDQLYTQANVEELKNIDLPVYCWHDNPGSVSRRDSAKFTYHDGILGYAANMEYVYRRVSERNPNAPGLVPIMVGAAWMLYATLAGAYRKEPRYVPEIEAAAARFYRDVYCRIEARVTEKMIENSREKTQEIFENERLEETTPFSFDEFLCRLRNADGEAQTGREGKI